MVKITYKSYLIPDNHPVRTVSAITDRLYIPDHRKVGNVEGMLFPMYITEHFRMVLHFPETLTWVEKLKNTFLLPIDVSVQREMIKFHPCYISGQNVNLAIACTL